MGHIEFHSVNKIYDNGGSLLEVLKQAELTIAQGTFAAIWGPSGSGKSTLLNIIGVLDKPNSGEITIDNVDITSLSQKSVAKFRNDTIGFVFQSFHLLPVLTAAENVAWPLFIKGVSRKKRMQTAREKLSLVGLEEQYNKIPSRLSGGQRQRVAIARALVCEPKIILADEPTSNLDRQTAKNIANLLTQLNKESKVTLLCATHDPLLLSYAQQVICLDEGKLSIESTSKFNKGRASV